MHHAWLVTFDTNAAWAAANAKAIEAMADGKNPDEMYIKKLVNEYQQAWQKANDEDKKFLKRLKVPEEDIAKIVTRANTIAATDDWEPKLAD
jgi:hypothetical protein